MTIEWDELPDSVKTFMTAIDSRDDAGALAALTDDAVVTDEGHDHHGRAAIEAWMAEAVSGSPFTYTAEFTGATATDTGVEVRQHLEGDFPGGVVDLHYRFRMDGALIGRVVIEP
ncbi:nuclear transport factor 2 family protein [Rhodococcoides corynebacterioides]|uniref:nuclear transport factor 2 family protein n=1 Tax=Rhodococcoides corynebacterioides TaxID=53972 RepID=UPI003F7F07B9